MMNNYNYELFMMNGKSHFCTLRCPLIIYTILFTCHSLLEQAIELVITRFKDFVP